MRRTVSVCLGALVLLACRGSANAESVRPAAASPAELPGVMDDLGEHGLYRSGDETAEDWRRWTAGVGGMVVLRDSLFSQQDHPYLQAPRALMMPPSWVSVAVAETMAGRALRTPLVAPLEDDAAWAVPKTPAAMFGSFPVSDRLFEEARTAIASSTDPVQAQRTENARASIRALGQAASAMVEASATSAELAAETGAAWIAASDRNYFGTEQRARAIIQIFVEHPNEHESRDEGKGMGVWGQDIPAEAISIARHAVYARRLEDGALAVERYDLREQAEWDRAQALLEELAPRATRSGCGSTAAPMDTGTESLRCRTSRRSGTRSPTPT